MAPSRGGKGKAAARPPSNSAQNGSRRSKRPGPSTYTDDDVAEVYKSMVAEAETDAPAQTDRPLKRRRVAAASKADEATRAEAQPANVATSSSPVHLQAPLVAERKLQTVEDSSEEEGSDLEFEDVDLERAADSADEPVNGIEDLSIDVQPESRVRRNNTPRRKPGTMLEKAHRLLVHTLHILCLLGHCMYVNGRCNNAAAQQHVRSVLTSKTKSYLNPSRNDTQFQRNRSFMDGLEQAVNAFNAEYRVTGSGMRKPHWSIDGGEPEVRETGLDPTDGSDFVAAAKNFEGSQDMGNQLFCTLLRSVGVDARIVCSLQPLPFSSAPKSSTPKKPAGTTKITFSSIMAPSPTKINNEDKAIGSSKTIGKVPSARRRLGQPDFAAESSKSLTPKNRAKPVPKLQFPVFWVEAFNEAQQKWITVDPVVTNTVNKPSKLEPPAAYDLAQLIYVIAFEDDGTARDVTRRYAKAFNAKTRRHRVESSPNGAKWWKSVMRFFRRRGGQQLDREQVEDAELAQKEAKEGMPGNVLDFKDHPYYALERHLKRHETIHPRREVGKVNAGTSAKPRLEPVFRRQDVQICRSADKWYRVGREIKEGEQPLKHVAARARRQLSVTDEVEPAATTALYAPFQTKLYVPPPVQRGRIPKNMYGNLDIYVPSMVPPGGTHVRHALAQRAAKVLKVDYADAVTGFKFQGRHGTAIVEGAVVAEQYADAIWAVIESIEYEMEEEASRARSLIALKLWKRFLTGLRVAERVSAYADSSTRSVEEAVDDEDEFVVDPTGVLLGQGDDAPLITAGQFSLAELSMRHKPARQKKRQRDSDTYEQDHDSDNFETYSNLGGGFVADDDDEGGGGFMAQDNDDDDGGGGFMAEDNHDDGAGGFITGDIDDGEGGGFLPDAHSNQEGGFMSGSGEADDDLFGDQAESQSTSGNVQEDQAMLEEQSTSAEISYPVGNGLERDAADNVAATNHDLDEPQEQSSHRRDDKPIAAEPQSKASQKPEERDGQDSLPSEDPDDDQDMEPDWLESD